MCLEPYLSSRCTNPSFVISDVDVEAVGFDEGMIMWTRAPTP
jgi:hypothetical protein